jgi:hypothetical protein
MAPARAAKAAKASKKDQEKGHKYVIDCSAPCDDKIMDAGSFVR